MRDQPTEIGLRIAKLRSELRLSRERFGEPLGIKGTKVQDIERGRQKPTADVLAQIQDCYRPNPKWLLEGVGEIFLAPGQEPAEVMEPRAWLYSAKKAVRDPVMQARAGGKLERYKTAERLVAELLDTAELKPNPLLHESLKMLAFEGAKTETLMLLLRGVTEQVRIGETK
ncbi:helix-turn-helix domain-containing protein [Hydrocarboniphaga effusa]|uniref:helix-turn-helix domain-containing protein n=1 Tax=Hydrocarboniphaga effusa TaxID=243629 RepID=UPI003BAB4E85